MRDKITVLSGKLITRQQGSKIWHEHYCPGCEMLHQIAVVQPFHNGATWYYNDNAERPTFIASINIGQGTRLQCHYIITDGLIAFQHDCYHHLKGHINIAMPDIPLYYLD
jgi:hypothetical protein